MGDIYEARGYFRQGGGCPNRKKNRGRRSCKKQAPGRFRSNAVASYEETRADADQGESEGGMRKKEIGEIAPHIGTPNQRAETYTS